MSTTPQSFQFVDSSSASKTGQTLPIGAQAGATSVSSVPASDLANIEPGGTPITGASMPAGGVGMTGWLSAIWSKLSGSLAVTGTFWQATQPVSAASGALVDGADATQGSKADSAATNGTSAWSAIALLKWIGASLAGYLSVNLGIGSAAISHTNAVYVADAYASAVTGAWNNATSTGTTVAVPTTGMDGVMLSIVASGTVSSGHVTFEAYDGAAWLPIKGFPLEAYYSYQGYTLATGLNNGLQFDLSGCLQFRVRLDTAITGSGSVLLTINASSAPLVPGVVAGLDPTATNPVTMQAGSAVIGKVGIDQTTPGTTNGVVVNSSSNVIGYAGSLNFQTAPVVPTIQTAAYASGNVIGGKLTITNVFRNTTQPSATLSQFMLGWAGTETVAVTVYLFSRNPTSGTYTDKTAMTLAAADAQYLVTAPFTLTAAASAGATQTFAAQSLSLSVQNLDSTVTRSLYAVLVVGAAVTPAGTSDLFFSISGVQD